jgi:hypothetical protein
MREYIFHGKRVDNGEWVEGYLGYNKVRNQYYIMDDVDSFPIPVHKESVGQYTGMNEFVVTDRSYNKSLFEGDIVEVWSTRRPKWTGYPKSKHDGDIKVRAVICFKRGSWSLDYENKYNEALEKLRGKEEDERTVDPYWELYHFGCHYNDEEWEREHNAHYKWHDIKKIGNVFENADLLEV